MRGELHVPSLKGGRSAKRRESVVAWSNQGFGHPSLGSFRPVLQCVGSSMLCTVIGGEMSDRFAIGGFKRSPPHLFLYLALFERKTKVKTRRDSAGVEHRGV